MAKKKTKEEFINECNIKHNNLYDYTLVDYIDCNTKVKIICPIHGEFEQRPYSHLKAKIGCGSCSNRKKMTNNDFINKAIQKHGNKYDYSLVNYIDRNTKVKIICPIHGEFEIKPEGHLN